MDSNHRRQTQQPPADGAGDDWRSQLQYNSRQRMVKKIMDTLKRHLPSSDQQLQQGVQELRKIAMTLEQKVYHEATSQIKIMEGLAELHYSEIHGVYQKVCSKIQQHDSLSLQAKSDGAVMLNSMKDMLERIMQCFQMSRTTAHTFCNDKLRGLGKETISIMNSQITQAQSHENGINSQLQSVHVQGSSVSSLNGITSFQPNMMNSARLNLKLELGRGNAPAEAPSTSSDSTAPTNISGSQEEVYQKMQGMKNLYLQEVQGIYQKICLKVKQAEFLSQQAKSDGLVERLKRNLERIIQYFSSPARRTGRT